MNYEQIEETLKYNEKESDIFMPNEIFEELIKNFKKISSYHEKSTETITIKDGKERKRRSKNSGAISSHIAFSYAYYYLCVYLYRNTKYTSTKTTVSDMKQILGYSPNNQKIDFIIKKGGLLDQWNFTSTTTDYPVRWTLEDKRLDFQLITDKDEVCEEDRKIYLKQLGRNYKVKYPFRHFYRDMEAYEEDYINGVFEDTSNTHLIPFEVFLHCMGNAEIGCIGFYLYCYLKMKNDHFKGGYDVSMPNLSEETGIKSRTVDKYMDALKRYKLVDCIYNQDFYVIGLNDDRKANTYITNDYIVFRDEKVPVKKLQSITLKDYVKLNKEREKLENNVTDGLDCLPSNF